MGLHKVLRPRSAGEEVTLQVFIMRNPYKDLYKVAVCNVRTMARPEKLEKCKKGNETIRI